MKYRIIVKTSFGTELMKIVCDSREDAELEAKEYRRYANDDVIIEVIEEKI